MNDYILSDIFAKHFVHYLSSYIPDIHNVTINGCDIDYSIGSCKFRFVINLTYFKPKFESFGVKSVAKFEAYKIFSQLATSY